MKGKCTKLRFGGAEKGTREAVNLSKTSHCESEDTILGLSNMGRFRTVVQDPLKRKPALVGDKTGPLESSDKQECPMVYVETAFPYLLGTAD